jgi:hypothetical protein
LYDWAKSETLNAKMNAADKTIFFIFDLVERKVCKIHSNRFLDACEMFWRCLRKRLICYNFPSK